MLDINPGHPGLHCRIDLLQSRLTSADRFATSGVAVATRLAFAYASTWTTPVDSRLSPSILRHSSNSSIITPHHLPAVNFANVEWRKCTLQARALWSTGSRAIINTGHHIVHSAALESHITKTRAVIRSLRACHFAHAVPCWR